MSIGLLIFYGVAVAIIISGGLTVFLLVRRKSRLLAAVSGFASTSVLVLIWPIPLLGKGTVGYGWQSVEYAPGQSAWLDTANGQIWSDWLPLPDTRSMPSLELARRYASLFGH